MLSRWQNQKGMATDILIFSLLVVAAGIVFVNIAQQSSVRREYAKTWPRTEGVILRAEIDNASKKPSPAIEYEYRIGETVYRGSRFLLHGGTYETLESFEDGIRVRFTGPDREPYDKEYRKGQPVEVSYNPEVPKDSVLLPLFLKDMRVFLISGILLVLIGMLLAVRAMSED